MAIKCAVVIASNCTRMTSVRHIISTMNRRHMTHHILTIQLAIVVATLSTS